MKVFRSLENRGTILKGTSKKIYSQEEEQKEEEQEEEQKSQ